MALADLKAYYKEFERTHIEEREMLEEAAKIAEEKGMYQETVDNLRDTFQRDDKTYMLLSYLMFLLELPKRQSKRAQMLTRDEKLVTRFSEFGLDIESVKADNEEMLHNFRDYINSLKEE